MKTTDLFSFQTPHSLNSESRPLINTNNTRFHVTSIGFCLYWRDRWLEMTQKCNVRHRVSRFISYTSCYGQIQMHYKLWPATRFLSSPIFPCSVHLNLCLSSLFWGGQQFSVRRKSTTCCVVCVKQNKCKLIEMRVHTDTQLNTHIKRDWWLGFRSGCSLGVKESNVFIEREQQKW